MKRTKTKSVFQSRAHVSLLLVAVLEFAVGRGGAATIVWSNSATGQAWLSTGNWTGGVVPGSGDIAQFGANPSATPYEVGINMNGSTNNGTSNQIVGAIETTRTSNPLVIGDSSGSTSGILTLAGTTVNSIANVILRNSGSQLLTLQDTITANSSSGVTMNVALGNATENVVSIDGTGGITISSIITGSGRNLTLRGAGAGVLTLSGSSSNTYSGLTTVSGSILLLGKATAGLNAFGGDLTISGGTVQYGTAINNQIPDAAKVTISSGTLAFGARSETIGITSTTTSGLALSGTGAITMSSGTVSIANSASITGGSVTMTSSGNFALNNSASMTGGSVSITGAGTFTVNTEFNFSGGSIALGTTGALNLRAGTGTGITYLSTGTSAASVTGSGGTLSLNTASGATTTFNIADASGVATELTVAVPITGSAKSIQKTGDGVLLLSGASTYSGGTTLTAGTIALGISSTGTTTVTNGPVGTGTLTLNGGTLSSSAATTAGDRTINNNLSLAGSITLGDTTNNGVLTFDNTALTTRSAAMTANTTLTTNSAVTIADAISGAFSLTKSGASSLTLTGGNSYSQGTIVNNGTLNANSTNSLGLSSSLTVNAAAGITSVVNVNASQTVNGLSGTIAGTGSATINIASGATLTTNQSTSTEYDGVITGAGGFNMSGTGASLLYLTNASNNYTGGTSINGGTLAVNGPNRLGSTSGALNINNGTYQLTTIGGSGTSIASARNVVLGDAASTISVDAGLSYNTVTSGGSIGIISGSGTLNKAGTGTLVLAGANTYSGGTTVIAGTLLVNNTTGSGTGTGTVTVNGGLLGGNGIITGPSTGTTPDAVNVGTAGTISAGASGGNSIGILTVGYTTSATTTPTLTLNGTMLANLTAPVGTSATTGTAGTNNDQISVLGALTLGGTSTLSVVTADDYGMVVGQVFYIALNDGVDPISGTFTQGTTVTDNLGDTFTISYTANGDGTVLGLGAVGNDISLTVSGVSPTPVPEPATVLSGLLIVSILGWNQRRRIGGWLAATRSRRTALAA